MKHLTMTEVNFLLKKPEFKEGLRTKAIGNNFLEHSQNITIKFIHLPCVCYINEQNQISVMAVTRLRDYESLLHKSNILFKWRLYFEDNSVIDLFEFVDEKGFFGDGTRCEDWHLASKRVKLEKLEG